MEEVAVTGSAGSQHDPIDLDDGDGDTTDKVPVVPSRRPAAGNTTSSDSIKSSGDPSDTANVTTNVTTTTTSSGPTFMPTPVTEATYDEPSFNVKIPKKGMTTEEAAALEQKMEQRERDKNVPSVPARPSRPSRRPVTSSSDIEGSAPTSVEEAPVAPSRRPAASLEPQESEFKAASTPFQPIESSMSEPSMPESSMSESSVSEPSVSESSMPEPSVPERPSRPSRPSSRPSRSLTPAESDEALEQRIAKDKEMGIEVGLGPMDRPVARGVPKDDMALLHEELSRGAGDPTAVRSGPPIKAAVPKDDIALMVEAERSGATGIPTSDPGDVGNPGNVGNPSNPTPLDSVALKQKQEEEDDNDDDNNNYTSRKVPLDAVAMEMKRQKELEGHGEDDEDTSAPVGLDDVALEELEESRESELGDAESGTSGEPRIPSRPARPAKRPSPAAASTSPESLSAAREATLDLSKENPVPLADEEEEEEGDAIIEPAAEKPVAGVGAAEKELEEVEGEVEEVKQAQEDVPKSQEKDVESRESGESRESESRESAESRESESRDPAESADDATPIAAATSSVTSAAAAATAGIAAAAASVAAVVVGGEEKDKDDAKDAKKEDQDVKDKDGLSLAAKDAKNVTEDTSAAPSPTIPPRPKPVSRTGSNLSGKSPLIPPRPMKRPGNNTSSSSLGAGLSSDNLALSDGKSDESCAKPVDAAKTDESSGNASQPDSSAPVKPTKRPPPVKPKPKIGAAFQAALEEKDKEFKPKPRVPVRSNKISALAKGLDGMFGAAGGPMVFGAPMPKKEVEEEEEVSETGVGSGAGGAGVSHDLPPIGVDKEKGEGEESGAGSGAGSSRRGRVKGPKRKLPSSAVSPWSCSVISDVWELVPKVEKVVEEAKEGAKEKAHEAKELSHSLSRDLESKSHDLESKIDAHLSHLRSSHPPDSSDDDFEDAREHVQHDNKYISSVGKKKNDGHVHAVPRRLSEALDTAGHPTVHVDVVRGGETEGVEKAEEAVSEANEPVSEAQKSVSEAKEPVSDQKPVSEPVSDPPVPSRPSRRPKNESGDSETDSLSSKAPTHVNTTSTSVHKDIPAPVAHTVKSTPGNPEDALYDSNDDVARFSTSDKPLYTVSEPDVIKSATHHHPYEVGSVSEPDVIKSATHHMKEQPFSEAVDVEGAVEAGQTVAESGESPTSVYSPAPTSAVEESPIDRKQSVGSIIGGYLDSPTKEVETIEEE